MKQNISEKQSDKYDIDLNVEYKEESENNNSEVREINNNVDNPNTIQRENVSDDRADKNKREGKVEEATDEEVEEFSALLNRIRETRTYFSKREISDKQIMAQDKEITPKKSIWIPTFIATDFNCNNIDKNKRSRSRSRSPENKGNRQRVI